jgi:hypothetical protein
MEHDMLLGIRDALEHDMLLRIRDALHPFPFCVFPGEVYSRRNMILTELVHHKGWDSDQIKLEVIALIFQYWTHGSHPPPEALRRIVPTTTGPVVAQYVVQHVDPEPTEVMLEIWAQLCERVPDVADPESEVDDPELCHSCNRHPVCEYTPPECLSCYDEH